MADPFDPTRKVRPAQEGDTGPEADVLAGQFREEKGGALLGVELPPLQPKIELGGKTFVLKPETHVTLVGFGAKLDKKCKEAAAAHGEPISNSVAAERVKTALQKAAEGMTFQIQLSPETRKAQKGEAQTIIKMCEVVGLAEYLQRVATELGLPDGAIELPPTHTTVYTLENGQAVGISTEQQLAELTTVLEGEELEELRRISVVAAE